MLYITKILPFFLFFVTQSRDLLHELDLLQGAIVSGNHADIVVWEPDTEFELDENHTAYHKHPVCFTLVVSHFRTIPSHFNMNMKFKEKSSLKIYYSHTIAVVT